MSNEHEEYLEHIAKDFPNQGKWRVKEKDVFKTKGQLLVAIRKMRMAKMADKDIAAILADTFWGAYCERDAQIKERTGLTPKELCEHYDRTKPQKPTAVNEAEPEPELSQG